MSSEHTPEEWIAKPCGGQDCDKWYVLGGGFELVHMPKLTALLVAAAPDLLASCDKAAVYFYACSKAWAANNGSLIADDGRPIVEAEGLDQLCDTACESVFAAITKAKGGAS